MFGAQNFLAVIYPLKIKDKHLVLGIKLIFGMKLIHLLWLDWPIYVLKIEQKDKIVMQKRRAKL